MKHPTFEMGEPRGGEREIRIEFERALIELLGLLELFAFFRHEQIHCLDVGEISFTIFGRPLRDLRFFGRRKLRLQRASDSRGQIGLDFEYVAQVPIVIFRPEVLVVGCVDQLDIHAHFVAGPAHTALENVRNP